MQRAEDYHLEKIFSIFHINYQVAVRVRPLLDTNDVACVQVSQSGNAILLDEGTSGSRNKFRRYVYDHVFNETSQEMVYQKTTAALVKDVLNGFSAAVFAYGATGSGNI